MRGQLEHTLLGLAPSELVSKDLEAEDHTATYLSSLGEQRALGYLLVGEAPEWPFSPRQWIKLGPQFGF